MLNRLKLIFSPIFEKLIVVMYTLIITFTFICLKTYILYFLYNYIVAAGVLPYIPYQNFFGIVLMASVFRIPKLDDTDDNNAYSRNDQTKLKFITSFIHMLFILSLGVIVYVITICI